ncbi:glucan 1,4-alpha-maltotetraohydrolase domain-containing protein [Marinoscillum furvescens]|uniref:Putative secreted protein (Por secretion system target) n=1 Tax=Marinoscillum furvescens DSM 4134 TaxID=1122208 RepID=A0A3D9L6H8_MARFU|nr:glucan 1,4-alpha-maltotetraohydrolase domain-containing protein [Marinoscillum furvescens]REE01074.1 putative secreted protein (Por secretion system target) [Marinoscillum furvescens DSM 4134]
MRLNLLGLFALLLCCTVTAQVANDGRVLLQGFYWESSHDYQNDWYQYVEAKAADMDAAGIDLIWLPPPSDAGSWEGYLPRELNNFANSYGSLSEHQSLLSTLDGYGIDAIADIVVNHRVGSTNWVDFTNPTWGTNSITADDEVWSEPAYSGIGLRGNYDTGTPYAAARDVDHTQTFVQNDIKAFLDNLKALGYDGWRYDFVHGFSTQYISMYNNHTSPTYSVGENWNSDKQVIQDWIDASGSAAFDFPTYYALKGVIRDNNYSYLAYQGAPAGGIGWDPKNYSTFIENHDTPDYDPNNNVLNASNVGQAYAYLLTHPGVPCIFWSHMYEWGTAVTNELKTLIQLRKAAGIHSQSPVTIHRSESGLYVASIAGDNHTVFLKMGYTNWGDPANEGMGGSWSLAASGTNYAIWSEATSGGGGGGGTSMTVYAQNYTHAYAWDDNQNALLGAWPGSAMSAGANGWNEITVPATCTNIIFSYNGGSQTADLSTCDNQPYYYNGTWHATDPTSGGGNNTLTVYAQGYTHCYAWDDNLNPLLGSWPGSAMNSGNPWNSITIPASCSNVIFSYNGGGQTADLYTCGPDAYWNGGSWSSSGRTGTVLSADVAVHPNPFFDHANVSFTLKEQAEVRIQVFSSAGKQMKAFDQKLSPGSYQVQLSAEDLPPSEALYILRMQIGEEQLTRKLIMK